MKLTMLGTGNALVTQCYNTCFVISENNQYFLVDGGGGNTILQQLEKTHIHWMDIKDIFVTHKHIDHLLGVIWMIRMIGQYMNKGEYEGDVRIYAHQGLIETILEIIHLVLNKKQLSMIHKRIHMINIEDGQTISIIGHNVTFFDIHSTKDRQFGFTMKLPHQKITCCGDEPYHPMNQMYVQNSDWLLHEAFCLDSQADIFHPYEKHHSTVKDACQIAQSLNIQNLILYHTEDKNIQQRRSLYLQEGQKYFQGNIFVPDDLETIIIQ